MKFDYTESPQAASRKPCARQATAWLDYNLGFDRDPRPKTRHGSIKKWIGLYGQKAEEHVYLNALRAPTYRWVESYPRVDLPCGSASQVADYAYVGRFV